MALLLGEEASDGGKTPFLVRLMKFSRLDTARVQGRTELLKAVLVSSGEMDV